MSVKAILAISLIEKKKYKAYAVFDGENLVIESMERIQGVFNTWKGPLIREIVERKRKGFSVVVEEMGSAVSQFGTRLMLEDMDQSEGKTKFMVALDAYFGMANMGSLVLPQGAENFRISERIAERYQEDQGRIRYRIDWEQFNGGHRVVLLAVLAATSQNQLTEEWIMGYCREMNRLQAMSIGPMPKWVAGRR